MTNAKTEFLAHTAGINSRVKCATISNEHHSLENPIHFKLPRYYTYDQLQIFLESLDFKYDSGYGSQHLYGYIWYLDGTWSSRYEYDGSEYWIHNTCPNIPNELCQPLSQNN